MPTSSESPTAARRISSGLIAGLLAVCAFVWSTYWLARYPGVMTPDSIDQWGQLISGNYNDWHPVASTLSMKLAVSVWWTPAAVVLLQLLLMLGLVAAILYTAIDLGASRATIVALALTFALVPAHGAMLACVWKDIPFAIGFGAFTLMLVQLTAQPQGALGAGPAATLLALAFTVSLLRHNGPPAAFAGLGALALAQPARRRRLCQLLVALALGIGAWQWGVRHVLQAPGAPTVKTLGILPLQQIATIVASNPGAITPVQREQLEAVAPWSAWVGHTGRTDVEDLKFNPAFDSAPIQKDPAGYFRLWRELVTAHPALALRAAARQSGVIWNPLFAARDTYPTGILTNPYGLQSAPPWPGLNSALERTQSAFQHWPAQVLANPACAHFLLLGAAVCAVARAGWRALVPFLPWLVLVAVYALILPVPDFRYFYPSFVVLPILLLHAAIMRAPTSAPSSHA